MDRAISWRMKRPAYAPTTVSSSPSRSRCKTHCPSWNTTGRRKTFPYAYRLEPREAKPFTRLVITRPPAYVRNMSPAEIEEAVKGLKREELAKLASYIPLRATRADPILALAHNA